MQNHIPEEFSKVYFPSTKDASVYAGNSSRLSFAIRQKIALRSDMQLTTLENARWALQVKILDRNQSIVAVDSCKNPSTPSVASGSYLCTSIHPELTNTADTPTTFPTSFNQPSISPSQEKIDLNVEAKAIDLNTGQTMWAKLYSANNIPSIVFNEIGDTDGNTTKYTQWTPDLHGLRYQEAIDNTVKAYSEAIAFDVQKMIFSSMPKKGDLEKSNAK
ncbi:hypothetical protein [Silvanigrella aquatica]|nr:hypothetical protein [Silvanigrella aquatica]